jgi:hypothetical protein
VSNTVGAKVFMLAVHVVAVLGGILGGVWVFDQFSRGPRWR